jgi:UDP-N-acetylmuramate dehydrogenase
MEIRENISLARYITLKVGGPAKFFCEAKNEEEILEALKFAREKNLPVFVLGGGSNVLISDKGFDGVVIKILNTKYQIQDTKIECGSGCQLGTIVNESVKAGLTGLEWAAGIPGTVGGAVRGNAGAFGSSMSNIVESVRALEIPNSFKVRPFPSSSEVLGIPQGRTFKSPDCQFAYRDSIFKQNPNLIIISVILKLKKGNRAESERKVKEILEKRRKNQPDFPSPGSFFKNPETEDKNLIKQFETDTGKKITNHPSAYKYSNGKIKIPAPWLIEEAGLKGKKIGGAMVSDKHANFIVNTGDATAENVVMLAAIIKTRVRNKFGIQLKEEVEMVGF